ncbi:MAG: glycosyltransferase family 2 protein [Akkermansia sp.]|nr:glycosyltransferase family 2 protein [Akkermansia sp.]
MSSTNLPLLSIVVPCFNEESTIMPFLEESEQALAKMADIRAEIIFVDDGSTDSTLEIIKSIKSRYADIRWVSFSRNFGKESALLAGLEAAKGDYVTLMDADLQDPPSLLPELLKAVRDEGYDSAGTRRSTRKGEPVIRSWFARRFYRLMNAISEIELVDGARDYRLFTRNAVNALLSLREYNRFSKGLFSWIGFKTKWFEYENIERVAGTTKWSFFKLFHYSIESIIAFTTTPLVLSAMVGCLMMFASIICAVVLAARQMIYHNSVTGWTSMVIIIMALSGMQLFFFGIIGQYIAKMYMETKRRPLYIVRQSSDQQR